MPLSDWTDLSPSAITPSVDDTTRCWEPVIGGPLSSENLGRTTFEVWGRPDLIVGPHPNAGQYTDIQSAINALAQSQHTGIYILNGTYQFDRICHSGARDLRITGESRAGVVIQNTQATNLFYFDGITGHVELNNFTIDSVNTGSGNHTYMIRALDSSGDFNIEKLTFNFNITNGGMQEGDRLYMSDITGDVAVTGCIFTVHRRAGASF